MDWTFVIYIVLCLLQISDPCFAHENKSVHNQIQSLGIHNGVKRNNEPNIPRLAKHSTHHSSNSPSVRKSRISLLTQFQNSPQAHPSQISPRAQGHQNSPRAHQSQISPKAQGHQNSPRAHPSQISPRAQGHQNSPRAHQSQISPKAQGHQNSPRAHQSQISPRAQGHQNSPRAHQSQISPRAQGHQNSPRAHQSQISPKAQGHQNSPRAHPSQISPRAQGHQNSPRAHQSQISPKAQGHQNSPRAHPSQISPREQGQQNSPRAHPSQISLREQGHQNSPRAHQSQISPREQGQQNSPRAHPSQISPREQGHQNSPRAHQSQISPREQGHQNSPRAHPSQISPRAQGHQNSPRAHPSQISPRASPRSEGHQNSPRAHQSQISPRAQGHQNSPPAQRFQNSPRAHQPQTKPLHISLPVALGNSKENTNVDDNVKHNSNHIYPRNKEKLKDIAKRIRKAISEEHHSDKSNSSNGVIVDTNKQRIEKQVTEPLQKIIQPIPDLSGVLEHLAEKTQFLRKKTPVKVNVTYHSPPALDDVELANNVNSQLETASELNNREDEILKDLQKLNLTNRDLAPELTTQPSYNKPSRTPSWLGKNFKAHKTLQSKVQKRDVNHKYNIPALDFYNLPEDEMFKRSSHDQQQDTPVRSFLSKNLLRDNMDYQTEIENNRLNKQDVWFDRFLNKRTQKAKLRDKNNNIGDLDDDKDDAGTADDDDDDEDEDDDTDDGGSDDDVVKGEKEGVNNDTASRQDNDAVDKRNSKDDAKDTKSLNILSKVTQFLHKKNSKTTQSKKKPGKQPKSKGGMNEDIPLERLKNLLGTLDTSKRKGAEEEEIKDDETENGSEDQEPKKASKMFKEYQEPYIPPANSETGIIANAVLWIGVGVGTAFSAIMFILCCSFYKCLFYYRFHLSPPLKSFLESYEDKCKRSATKANTDDDTQYVISISDKKEEGLGWSSEEEEVFDINAVKKSGSKSVKKPGVSY